MPRCFSEEGTIKGAERQIDRLKDLGVTVIYFTPLNIADTHMDKSMWSTRQKLSGFNDPRNPYRAGDYFHVDPEYGSDQDLKDFVDHAHSLGMKVFLDIVFHHCGPGAQVIKQHPEYMKYDSLGKMALTAWGFPTFDFDNKATRSYLKSIMTYYIADYNVDGFRCDVADRVPIDFWDEIREDLKYMKPDVVIVAEGEKPESTISAFDATYDWPICEPTMKVLHQNKDIIENHGGAALIRNSYEAYKSRCPKGALAWNMIENHDYATDAFENRVEKVYGHECNELGLAFIFALDGIPFIFSGQEVCFDKRVSLFGHKDCWIDWNKECGKDYALDRTEKIKQWVKMRKEYSSLAYGQTLWIDNNQTDKICSFRRSDGKSNDVIFIGNFSPSDVRVKLENGQKYTLKPWGYIFKAE